MSDSNRKIIIDAITRMLARREHSAVEIIRKLADKGIGEQDSRGAVEEFRSAGIQSDYRFAEMKIRAAYNKGQGPQRIIGELAQHKISGDCIKMAMDELSLDWFALAARVREKKFGEQLPEDFRQRQKQQQFLQYRGFSSEHIQEAVNGD
ncbi:regulatory protein RecX [Alteromonas aestuariivivens]|uniref:Regulatory protein RecX n=2 Tax=Alteromonas aestuariivivens TaxID=1938339 RepID=A0A3D8M687_9ALTE|nr:regulatory protein RecX [Alteromonas aestuariivivens]